MLMGTNGNFRAPSTQLEHETAHAFQDAYLAFASDPANGLAQVDWRPYQKLGSWNVREFGAGVAAHNTRIAETEVLCNGVSPIFGIEECPPNKPRCTL